MIRRINKILEKALSDDPVVKISNLNIKMIVSSLNEDMLISIGELDEDIFTMANERALLKAIHAYINEQ